MSKTQTEKLPALISFFSPAKGPIIYFLACILISQLFFLSSSAKFDDKEDAGGAVTRGINNKTSDFCWGEKREIIFLQRREKGCGLAALNSD